MEQLVRQGKETLGRRSLGRDLSRGYSRSPGQTGRYGIGGAVLAAKSGYPVVPVAHNAGEVAATARIHQTARDDLGSRGSAIRIPRGNTEMIKEEAKDWIERNARELELKVSSGVSIG